MSSKRITLSALLWIEEKVAFMVLTNHVITRRNIYQNVPKLKKKKKNWQSSCWREANAKILHVLHSPQEPGTRASGADGVEEG